MTIKLDIDDRKLTAFKARVITRRVEKLANTKHVKLTAIIDTPASFASMIELYDKSKDQR